MEVAMYRIEFSGRYITCTSYEIRANHLFVSGELICHKQLVTNIIFINQ